MTKDASRQLTRRRSRPAESAAATAPAPLRGHVGDAFFRHIVGGMRNGVLAFTRDGRLALINDEAYRIFAIDPKPSDLGERISSVLKSQPELVRMLAGVFELHHLPNRAEMRVRPTGKVIGYTLAFVRDDDGATIGVAMFFKDLTHVEQMEERERLRDRLAAVGQMAAVIAHEVKNPLAGIEVMAGLLRRKIADAPDAQAVLTDIIKEAKMANAIVQEVLDFVRPIRLQVERTSIATAVQGAIHLAETKARRGSIAVDIQLPGDLPLIQADEHQLTQVFTNLLINAYEAMNGHGRVLIEGKRVRIEDGAEGRDAVQIDIADDGPGIAHDVVENVFDPFFSTKPQGSGLGLAIVRKIVNAHDGRLDLRTTPGHGTTIRLTLPVSGTDEA